MCLYPDLHTSDCDGFVANAAIVCCIPPSPPPNYCPICGNDPNIVMTRPSAFIDGAEQCAFVDKLGRDGELTPAECSSYRTLAAFGCGCSIPTGDGVLCRLCPEGQVLTDPESKFNFEPCPVVERKALNREYTENQCDAVESAGRLQCTVSFTSFFALLMICEELNSC